MNCKNLSIKNPEQISDIVNIIHDCWFDVDDIVYDPEASVLSLKFKREMPRRSRVLKEGLLTKRLEVPIVECFLRIHHVKSYRIKDTEHVGLYNFNELEYDPNLKHINITTGVPIDIIISVERFEVSVEETDKVIETKIVTSIFNLND